MVKFSGPIPPFSRILRPACRSGMIFEPLKGNCRTRLLIAILLCGILAHAKVTDAQASRGGPDRYTELRRLIKHNRHLSAHLVFAVDARTIKVVRAYVTVKDIPVLVKMMGDKNYGAASAASGLLATLGRQAVSALMEAAGAQHWQIAGHARDALRLIDDCYDESLRAVINPDVCPIDRFEGYR